MATSILCIGGAVLDRKYRTRNTLVLHTSNPADGFRSFGGVARNVAENLARLGAPVAFASLVGDDEGGRALAAHLAQAGADVSAVATSRERPTAEYVAILDHDNELAIGIADMAIFDGLTPAVLAPALDRLPTYSWVFFDCNLPVEAIAWLFAQRTAGRFRLACDTVSTPKAARLPRDLSGLDLIFTNLDEAAVVLATRPADARAAALALCAGGAAQAVVTAGSGGLVTASGGQAIAVPALPAAVVDITGAGDGLIAGTLAALLDGAPLAQAARHGIGLATLTIESHESVRSDLSAEMVRARVG